MKKKFIKLLVSSVAVAATVGGLASCTRSENQSTQPKQSTTNTPAAKEGLTGEYCTVDGRGFTFTSIGNSFILNVGQTYTGSIVKNGSKYDLTLEGSNLTASAEIVGDVVKLTFNGETFEFNLKKTYTVKYVVNGGTKIEDEKVKTGDYASYYYAEKEGYQFVDWYVDENLTEPYDFGSTVKSDLTLYAKFIKLEAGQEEYNVKFMDENGEVYEETATIGGVVAVLPTPTSEGKEFAGWYMSSSNEVDKLTKKYEGEVLTQDTNLYAVWNTGAPIVSISENSISWTSIGMNVNYNVTITSPNGEVEEFTFNKLQMEYDFKTKEAGEFEVTVSANSKSTTAYYYNKRLDRVSGYNVIDGKYLVFKPVANADHYEITVECGNESHEHNLVELGSNTFYDFSGCEMTSSGIRFTVYALADGYVTSSSDYVYMKQLESISNISYDKENDVVTWSRIADAISYEVTVEDSDNVYTFNVGSNNSYSLAYFTGNLTVTVKPITPGYYSYGTEVNVDKTNKLLPPSEIELNGNELTWDAVAGAASYSIMINNVLYTSDTNSLELKADMLEEGVTKYNVKVSAIAQDAKNSSSYSAVTTFNYFEMPKVNYSNGEVSWNTVIGAVRYGVKVNDSKAIYTTNNSFALKFNKAGYNTVSVCYYQENGDESDWSTIEIYVNLVTYYTQGGTSVENEYYAVGDSVLFPYTEMEGYQVQGWYNIPDGGKNNGKRYEDGFIMTATPLILYAYWTPAPFEVELDLAGGEFVADETGEIPSVTQSVYYDTTFKLPVPVKDDELVYFEGWYAEKNGVGKRYTDAEGNALDTWKIAEDGITLYAYWASILVDYEEIKDAEGNVTSYRANASSYISLAADGNVRIEATYKGKPVTEIGSFASSSNLVKLSIPDTIELIPYETAFKSCYKLVEFEIYETEHEEGIVFEEKYKSYDGAIYYNNQVSTDKGWELVAYPYKKEGEYTIMPGTVSIPTIAMKSAKVTKITIPASVKNIGTQAFYLCSSLETVVFEKTPDGEEVVPLAVASEAFKSCTALTSFEVPARLSSFDETVFDGCKNLKTLTVEEGATNFFATDGLLCKNINNVPTVVFCPKGREGDLVIPSGINSVGTAAFKACTLLTSITIPEYVTNIAESAFEGCTAVTAITINENLEATEANMLSIATKAFYNCNAVEELIIPANVKSIGKAAFAKLSKVTTVTVNSVSENIKNGFVNGAFADVTTAGVLSTGYVTTVNIGKDVHAFDIVGVFNGSNNKLTTINVDAENPYYTVQDNVLYDKDVKNLIFYPNNKEGDFVVPETVEEIAAGAFRNKTLLTGITIGSKVSKIGEQAFYNCTGITNITFVATPDGEDPVELNIETSAFYSVKNVIELNLPTRLREIGRSAFYGCAGLTTINIPEGVTKMGAEAFRNCSNATAATIPSTLTQIYYLKNNNETLYDANADDFSAFSFCTKLERFNVAEGNTVYASSDDGILYLKTDNVVRQLCYCPLAKVGSVVVPKTVTKIGAKAFYNNKNITSLEFEEHKSAITIDGDNETTGTLTIGDNAFYYCENLLSVEVPNIQELSKSIFYGCKSLQSFTVPYTVKKIQNQAFYMCKALANLEFEATPEGVTPVSLEIVDASSYSYAPFAYCAIENLVLPERLTKIGKNTFYGTYGGGSDTQGGSTTYLRLKSVTIPSTVTTIGEYAFYYNESLKTVTFADNNKCTSIGNYAFSTCAIEEITLPEGASAGYTIGTSAFSSCKKLISVTIPHNVTQIGNNAFNYCNSLANVTFEDGDDKTKSKLTKIGNYAFAYYNVLESITLPVKLQELGDDAFYSCKSLKSVEFLGTDVKKIGTMAFGITALEEFTFPTYIVSNKPTAFTTIGHSLFYDCANLKTVNLGKSVKTVINSNYSIFRGCKSIETITVDAENENMMVDPTGKMLVNKKTKKVEEEDVLYYDNILYYFGNLEAEAEGVFDLTESEIVEISGGAFSGDNGILEVKLPKSLTKVGNYAFNESPTIKKVEFSQDTDAKEVELGTYVFNRCSLLEEVILPKQLINNKIDVDTFYQCKSLKSIEIPETVQTIGNYAFEYCSSLKEVVLPDSVKSIGTYSFAYCSSLESVTFPNNDSFTAIANYSFGECTSLKEVVIPDTVKTAGQNTFKNCKSLESITLSSQMTKLDNSFLSGTTSLKSIDFKNITEIGNNTFENSGLEELEFNELIKKIGNNAFANIQITEIVIPDTITYMGSNMFKGCKKLERAQVLAYKGIPGTTTTAVEGVLPDYTFRDCTALYDVELNENIKYIGQYAFAGTTTLRHIELPSQLRVIGSYGFMESGISEISIPQTVYALTGTTGTSNQVDKVTATNTTTSYTFQKCKNLKSVVFEGTPSIVRLNGYIFDGCTALEEFKLPENVNYVGQYAFRDTLIESIDLSNVTSFGSNVFGSDTPNEALKSVTLPAIATLSAQMFKNCQGLTEVVIPEGVKTIGTSFFESCENLVDVTLPSTLTTINEAAFKNCTSLTEIELPNSLSATGIGASSFKGSGLTSIVIPSSVTTIGNYAFQDCLSLENVTFDGEKVVKLNMSSFENTPMLKSINIPETVESIGNYAFRKSGLTGVLQLKSPLLTLGSNPFAQCANLTEVELVGDVGDCYLVDKVLYSGNSIVYYPASLTGDFTVPTGVTVLAGAFSGATIDTLTLADDTTELVNYALSGLENIKSIVLPEGLTKLGQYVFDGCGAESITLPSTLNTLSTYTFANSGFKTIELPDNFETIPNYLFSGSAKLESVTFGSKLTEFGTYVFQNCASIETFIAPSLETIGNYAFVGSGIKSVTVKAGVKYGTYVYQNCESLKTVVVEEGAKELANYMFMGCISLDNVTLPEGFEKIGMSAFEGCTSLTNIILPSTLNYLGSASFRTSGLISIVIPKGLDRIYSYAFQDCANLTNVEFEEGSVMNYLDSACFRNCKNISEIYIPATVEKIYYSFTEWTKEQTVYFEMDEETFKVLLNSTWRESGTTYVTDATFVWGVTKQ